MDNEFRRRADSIQSMLLDFDSLMLPGIPAFEDASEHAAQFARFEATARSVAATFANCQGKPGVTRTVDQVLSSLIHMHCNRLLGDREQEFHVHYMNQRATEGLAAHLRRLQHAASPECRAAR